MAAAKRAEPRLVHFNASRTAKSLTSEPRPVGDAAPITTVAAIAPMGHAAGLRQSIASLVSPTKAIFVLLLARCKRFAKRVLAHQDSSLSYPVN
jgi:hypothetical protein